MTPPVHQQVTTPIMSQHTVDSPVCQQVMTSITCQHRSLPVCQWATTPIIHQWASPPACQQVTASIACQQAMTPITSQQVMTPPTSQQLMSNHQAHHALVWLFYPSPSWIWRRTHHEIPGKPIPGKPSCGRWGSSLSSPDKFLVSFSSVLPAPSPTEWLTVEHLAVQMQIVATQNHQWSQLHQMICQDWIGHWESYPLPSSLQDLGF